MSTDAQAQMPRYKCHKEVWALKIASVTPIGEEGGEAVITPADEGYDEFVVPAEYMQKHKPQPGGYYVVYEDGYKSFSPAKAFEEGYTDMRHVVRRQMTAGAYEVVAGIVRSIADPVIRKQVADHFATEFNKRSATFDPHIWEQRTGGRPAPNSARVGKG